MTNLAFELDPLDLEEEEAELAEQSGSAKTSVSSVTTPPPHGKRIPFFKKVPTLLGGWREEGGQGPALGRVGCWMSGVDSVGTSLNLGASGPPTQ